MGLNQVNWNKEREKLGDSFPQLRAIEYDNKKIYIFDTLKWSIPFDVNTSITFIKEDYRLMHLIDITDMAKRSCLLEEQAHLDNLTRVYNRHRFLEFVDEIEDSLHPLLTRRLIEMVQDKAVNTKGAQLIFTTHDAMLLDLNFFRRDQIWFAEKNDETCATELYSLASFSPRKGENVRKGYLQGRFGAIPFIGGDA